MENFPQNIYFFFMKSNVLLFMVFSFTNEFRPAKILSCEILSVIPVHNILCYYNFAKLNFVHETFFHFAQTPLEK